MESKQLIAITRLICLRCGKVLVSAFVQFDCGIDMHFECFDIYQFRLILSQVIEEWLTSDGPMLVDFGVVRGPGSIPSRFPNIGCLELVGLGNPHLTVLSQGVVRCGNT